MTLRFCPTCGSLLFFDRGPVGMRLSCATCPYIYNVKHKMSSRIYYKPKEHVDFLSRSSAWEGVDSTDERCPRCSHSRAYFMQLQTRSADEPMTIFYKCCNAQCAHTWRDS